MTGVVFVFVREDANEAEVLAEAFEAAGFSITGNTQSDDALAVVIWSSAALRSPAFQRAAERALRTGKAIVASLAAPPPGDHVFNAPVVDLTEWDGEEGASLDPLLTAADSIAHPARARVIVLSARPIYEDAEFTELLPLQITSAESDSVRRARRSWEAPIPTEMLRPMRDEPTPKLGAPSPRRDFRRMSQRRPASRAHAALAFAAIALIGGGAFALNGPPAPHIAAEPARADGAVGLTSASAAAADLEDITPVEPPPLFEPAIQRGHAGLEPPSARSVRRAAPRRTPRDDRAAHQAPAPILETIVAELERTPTPAPVARKPSGPLS